MVNINNSLSAACHSINAAVQPKKSRHAPGGNVTKIEDVCKRKLDDCVKSSQDVEQALNIKLGYAPAEIQRCWFQG
jgi:translation initiation factor 2 gamma subunit (eIF-2gamma)